MNHTQIKAFHAVARLGSFSSAAEALFLTQPAISEQVRRLEQDNDILLFERGRKGVSLTATGEELFQYTKMYFELEDQIDGCLSEWTARLGGHLRIIADSVMHVAGSLSAFRARYPDVKVSIRAGNTETILSELRKYNAEIGVVGSLPHSDDIASTEIGSSPIIAFANKASFARLPPRMTLKDLSQTPLVMREAGSRTRQQVLGRARAAGIDLEPAFEVEGREAVRSIVMSGGGIGFVSQAEYSADDRLRTIEITDLDARMPESVIHLKKRKDVRLIRAFVGFVQGAKDETAQAPVILE